MSINKNYMQKIKYFFTLASFALALAFIGMPTATFASHGNETSGDSGYEYTSPGSTWYNDYSTSDYTSPGSTWYNDYSTSDYTSPGSTWYNDYSTLDYTSPGSTWYNDYSTLDYTSPGSTWNNDYTSYSSGCSNCGGSTGYSSTPSYSYGCSNCGGSKGYTSGSTPAYGCTNCGGSSGSSVPSYTYAPSSASSRSTSNPTNISTNTNTTGPSTSIATGGNASASTSVSSINNNNLSNNSPVNVVNNISVHLPYAAPTPTVNNDFSVVCTINPSSNVQIGQDVNFFANASGGNGNYSYSWTGSDGLNSSNQSFTGRFYNSGSKYATVTVYSNGQSRSATCSTNVGGNNNGNLSAYCTATPTVANTNQYVTWTAYPTGGNGNYSYSWTGSDGLSGSNSSVSQSYGSTGQKTATVTIYSNGQSITASCNATINAIYGYQTQASNVTLIKGTSDQIGLASGIYLGQLPATGISLSLKVVLFALGLLVWSIFAAFVVSKRKKTAGSITTNAIADFKARMLAMKNR